jgi:hypothetical protein
MHDAVRQCLGIQECNCLTDILRFIAVVVILQIEWGGLRLRLDEGLV